MAHPASGQTPTDFRKGLWLLVFEIRAAFIGLGGCTIESKPTNEEVANTYSMTPSDFLEKSWNRQMANLH
jgi:hypothetical protein